MFQIYPISEEIIPSDFDEEGELERLSMEFSGIFFFLKIKYRTNQDFYLHTLPFGHASHFPVSAPQSDLHTKVLPQLPAWYGRLVASSQDPLLAKELKVYKESLRSVGPAVLILNCLDNCYGHVIWKMLNAERHLKNDSHLDLILIIPTQMKWLVPAGVAELWLVECNLNQLQFSIKNFDEWVKNELERFQAVFLSKTFVHLDHHAINLKAFHKTDAFNLQHFAEKPPVITFVLRENRFWLSHNWQDFLYRVGVKIKKPKWFKSYFIRKQNNLVKKTIKNIKIVFPNLDCYAIGLGKTGSLLSADRDFRSNEINQNIEKKWCDIAAKSHIIIGIHGSHMIIPTSLAGGFINILPAYKTDNMVEDIAYREASREAMFLGRFLTGAASSKLVSRHVISMINIYPRLKKNTEEGKPNLNTSKLDD